MSEVIISASEAEELRIYLQDSSPALPPRLRALRDRLLGQLTASPALPPRLLAMRNRLESASAQPQDSESLLERTAVHVRNFGHEPEGSEEVQPSRASGSFGDNPKDNFTETSSDEVGDLILELLEESGLNDKFAQVSSLPYSATSCKTNPKG